VSVGDEGAKPEEKTLGQTFTIGGKTLDDYFDQRHRHSKITRGEMSELISLFVDKHTMAKALDVMRFYMRDTIRKEVEEEMGAFMLRLKGEPETTEGGIILPSGR